MGRDLAKAWYDRKAGEPALGYIAPTDAQSAIDQIYDDIGITSGDVTGPFSSIDGSPAVFDGSSGKILRQGARSMRWTGAFTTIGTIYDADDVTLDDDWLMIANKPTSDRPAPQASGDPFYGYTGVSMAPASPSAKLVTMGQRYEFQQSGWLNGWRLLQHSGQHYAVYTITDPEGTRVKKLLASFEATTDGWANYAIDPVLVASAAKFDLLVVVKSGAPAETTWTGDWDYTSPQNAGVPATGQIIHSKGSPGLLQVSKTDQASGDRSVELEALQAGDEVEAGATTWTIQHVADQASYMDFNVVPETHSSVGVQAVTFHTVTAEPVFVDWEAAYWPTSQHPQVEGLYTTTGGLDDAVLNTNAYGIDIQVQSAEISVDWDALSTSGGGSSGSSGSPTLIRLPSEEPTELVHGDMWVDAEGVGLNAYIHLNGVNKKIAFIA